jgi:predicted anti-sigma-YlaC factor YlaD
MADISASKYFEAFKQAPKKSINARARHAIIIWNNRCESEALKPDTAELWAQSNRSGNAPLKRQRSTEAAIEIARTPFVLLSGTTASGIITARSCKGNVVAKSASLLPHIRV